MIRRPPRSTLDRSSAASDVYKRQILDVITLALFNKIPRFSVKGTESISKTEIVEIGSVSYTHLRAHETVLDLVCRLLLEKKTKKTHKTTKKKQK